MASPAQVADTYDYMDTWLRGTIGEHADITGAYYDGDYRKTLQQAQHDKHELILSSLGVGPGHRFLDIGCGWGGLLLAAEARGASTIGLELSPKPARWCQRAHLDVRHADWRSTSPRALGLFDSAASVEALEHFCSPEEVVAGKQDAIYETFFGFVASTLRPRSRFYLQTMTWGKRVPDPDSIHVSAARGSDDYILSRVVKFFPGSWLPIGLDQIVQCAGPRFRCILVKNGRLDYIETMRQWASRMLRPTLRSFLGAMPGLLARYVTDRDFRVRVESLLGSYNKLCFERQLIDHFRIVFELVDPA